MIRRDEAGGHRKQQAGSNQARWCRWRNVEKPTPSTDNQAKN